jgi:hypothetical protein
MGGTVQAQTEEGGSSGISLGTLINALVKALKKLLRTLFTPIEGLIEAHGNSLLRLIVGTPAPEVLFQTPTNLPWGRIYQYYWGTIVPLALLLFGLAVGLVILLETTSTLFSSYHRANLKRRAVSGLFGVLSWWWIAAASLQLTDQLTRVLRPDLSTISLFETISFGGIGLIGLIVTLSADLGLFVLLALVYLARRLALYGFVLGMPLLMVAWIPGVGPFRLLAQFAKRLAGFYVPFLIMPIPIALLLRLAALLGDAATLSMGGIGAWLTALVIPFVVLIVPIVLFWQAGALLFIGERLVSHTSQRRVRTRLERSRDRGAQLRHESRNVVRGLRGQRAVDPDGQTKLNASGSHSRGHQFGSRLRRAGRRLGGLDRPDEPTTQGPTQIDPHRFEPKEFDRTGTDATQADQQSTDRDRHTTTRTDRTDE